MSFGHMVAVMIEMAVVSAILLDFKRFEYANKSLPSNKTPVRNHLDMPLLQEVPAQCSLVSATEPWSLVRICKLIL